MHAATRLIHLFVCLVLLWQGAAGALAAGRMAALDATIGGVACAPGGGDPRAGDPQAVIERALCDLACAAAVASDAPAPASVGSPHVYATARYDAPGLTDCDSPRGAAPPQARAPPVLS
jgi:hypothetical protein